MVVERKRGKHSVVEGARSRFFAFVLGIDRLDSVRAMLVRDALADLLAALADDLEGLFGESARVRPYRSSVEGWFRAASIIDAEARLTNCAEALGRTLDLGGMNLEIGVHFGFVDCAGYAPSEDHLEIAGVACRRAGVRHRRVVMADAETGSGNAEKLSLMRALQVALRNDLLDLHYQPKLSARTMKPHSVEGLIRWTDPELGVVRPDIFIPLAEESGDIRALTEWIVHRAVADQQKLIGAGTHLPIFLNVSSSLLGDEGYAQSLLRHCGDMTHSIGFEITETAMMTEPEVALTNLQVWSDAGIKLAIDDYGTGFSSLAYLRRLPVDELKIDRVFIARLSTSHRDPLLVRSTIDLAHALEMKVTAEGVDTPEAMALLQVMGCDLLQGYQISPPVTFEALRAFLSADQSDNGRSPIEDIRARLSRRRGRIASASPPLAQP